MKKRLHSFFFILLFTVTAAQAKTMQAMWSYGVFYAPEKGSYLETYLKVMGNSVVWKQTKDNEYQASINISITLRQGGTTKFKDNYNLLSPISNDTTIVYDFIDQQRILLPDGDYEYSLTIADAGRPLQAHEKPFQTTGKLSIYTDTTGIHLSDIELLSAFKKSTETNPLTRNGYDLTPLVDNYFGKSENALRFYVEIYNTDKILGDNDYLVTTQILEERSQKVFDKCSAFQKQHAKNSNAVLSELNITELPSGNYQLLVSVKNRSNETLAAKKLFFQRNGSIILPGAIKDSSGVLAFVKPMQDKDSLKDVIRCLKPIASREESNAIENVTRTKDVALMQQFISSFWLKRDETNPEDAWESYERMVAQVNYAYKTKIFLGCETDRGVVYLKYGKPDVVSENKNEPSAYPYEIWQYYKLNSQTNRKFVFYNPDLVTNDFVLLHSDATGEVSDTQWQVKLNRRNTSVIGFDDNKQPTHFGGKADEIFRNPK